MKGLLLTGFPRLLATFLQLFEQWVGQRSWEGLFQEPYHYNQSNFTSLGTCRGLWVKIQVSDQLYLCRKQDVCVCVRAHIG